MGVAVVLAVMAADVVAHWGEWCANFRLATRARHGDDIWAQQGDGRLGVGEMIRGRFGGGRWVKMDRCVCV